MEPYRYLINTKPDFERLLRYLPTVDIFGFDTETNGKFSRFEVSMVGLSLGFDEFACYIPLLHNVGRQLPFQYVIDGLKPIFEDPKTRYVAHNTKFDEMVLRRYGIVCNGSGDDTYIMAWLLSEDSGSKSLKSLVPQYLGREMDTYEDVINRQPKKRGVPRDYSFASVSLKDALSYAADDAYYTLRLYRTFRPRLEVQKLLQAYEIIERPFNRVLRDIEEAGVKIDLDYFNEADETLPVLAEAVETEIYEQAGEVFNIRATKKLGEILFDKLGIGSNVPKTKSGNYSTDKKTLAIYATKHKIVNDILRRKKIQKTHSTFVEGLKDFIDKDGKVHPSFDGCGTVTGRLSCRKPNLQQIEGDEVESIKVRNFFVPSTDEKVFVVADYSQIELRVMAHFAKDQRMIEAFKSGRDFHEEVTKGIFQEKFDAGSRKQRMVAKTLNFGVGYGRGPISIAEQLEITVEEAKKFIADWFEQFPDVAAYKKTLITQARKQGFIRTLSGRKRRLPNIRSDDWKLRGGAERQAFNTKIQGSAADIIKVAMISMNKVFNQEFFCPTILIQIHDELVVEVDREWADLTVDIMKTVMEAPLGGDIDESGIYTGKNPLILPLVTKPIIVEKWGEAK